VKPCSVVVGYHNTLHHEYGGSMILQNVAILPQARRLQLENMLWRISWSHYNIL